MEHDTKDEILVAGNATVQRGLHLHQLDKDGEGIEKEREREKKEPSWLICKVICGYVGGKIVCDHFGRNGDKQLYMLEER